MASSMAQMAQSATKGMPGAGSSAGSTLQSFATQGLTFAAIAGAVCGNGVLDPGEQCDDGNVTNGDCCSANCQIEATPCSLTTAGTIVAAVTAPTGGGNHNIAIIRDGDKPPVGTNASNRQYDTYDGDNIAAEDWIGYTYPRPQGFTRIVFQEGMHFINGGWFESLTAQVRQNGTWVTIAPVTITPPYPGYDNDVSFESYTLDFPLVMGDGIRIDGVPGGSSDFISVGELEVYGGVVTGAPVPSPTPTTKPTGTPTVTPTATLPPGAVSGHIVYYSSGTPVSGVTVELQGSTPGSVQTDAAGLYTAAGLSAGTWTVQPQRQGGQGEGVSSLDAAYVLQSLVGMRSLNADQALACDVSGDGTLSAFDAALILQYKVGLISRLPVADKCHSDWAFVPMPQQTPNQQVVQPQPGNAICQPGSIQFTPLSGAASSQDFKAFLFGDCTGNR